MTKPYGWIVTRDYLAEETDTDTRVGYMGPRGINPVLETRLEAAAKLVVQDGAESVLANYPTMKWWRAVDDDGEYCYGGLFV